MYRMLFLASLVCLSAFGATNDSNDSIMIQYESMSRYEAMFRYALKNAKGKDREQHSITGINFIYAMVPKNSHRWEKMKWSFRRYAINPYRFTMFSNKDISSKIMCRTCVHGEQDFKRILAKKMVDKKIHGKKKGVLVKRKMQDNESGYIHKKMSRKQLSSTLSHISIIKDAIDNKYENIWIMDSGTTLRCDPNIISQFIERANTEIPGWTMLYTDYGERDEIDCLEPIGNFYYRPDIDFKDAEEYLSRESFKNNESDVDYEDDGDDDDDSDNQNSSNISQIRNHSNPGRFGIDVGYKTNTPQNVFSKVGLTKGAHSYILNKKGIQLIWNWYVEHRVFIPYWIEIQVIPGMELYYIPEPITKNQNSS